MVHNQQMRPSTHGSKAQMKRDEIATAESLGLTVAEFRAKYAPWRLNPKRSANSSNGKRAKGSGKVGPAKRLIVYERDEGLCRYCGVELEVSGTPGPRSFTLDHVEPWSRGGSKDVDNLVAACGSCNQHKGDRTLTEAGMTLLPIGTTKEPPKPRVYKSARPAHQRDHWTSSGRPKLPWARDEAIELAANLSERDGMAMEPFPCPECDAWHLRILPGWGKLAYRRAHDYADAYLELDPTGNGRVVGNLRAENLGRSTERRLALRKRCRAALKKAERKSA